MSVRKRKRLLLTAADRHKVCPYNCGQTQGLSLQLRTDTRSVPTINPINIDLLLIPEFTTLEGCGAPAALAITPYPTSAKVDWADYEGAYDIAWSVLSATKSGNSGRWLQYDNGAMATNIGKSTASEQTWGVMYPPTMSQGYTKLSKVAFYVNTTYHTNDITVNIYQGENPITGTLLDTKTVTPAATSGMMEVELDAPLTIDPTQNLWITLTTTGTYVKTACSVTEPNDRWILNSGEWIDVVTTNESLVNYGWMIRGYVEDFDSNVFTWTTETGIVPPYTIENLTAETTYMVKVKPSCGTDWKWAQFTTPSACDAPIDLTAADITATTATLSWTGYQDSYNVQYREAAKYTPVWEDDFENGLDQWTIGHADDATAPSSGYWYTTNPMNGLSFEAHSGDYCASSWSWNSSAYNANNWLITPQLELQGTLRFYVRTNPSYLDSYEVLLSTTGNTINTYTYDESDTNHENPIFASGDFTTTLQAMAPAPDNGEWNEVVIDLSAYAGQQGYIAIHHVDYDMNYLLIDDFGIYNTVPAGDWISATATEATLALSGLTTATTYEWQVQGINAGCAGGVTDWSESAFFTTPLAISLADNGTDNSSIVTANKWETGSVTLAGRTLYKDGEWNTLCLPFDVKLAGSPLEGAVAKTLTDATMSGTTVSLTFGDDVTTLAAGTPYIIKWDAAAENIVEPTFTNVLIKNISETSRIISPIDEVKFIGYYDAFTINTPTNDEIYYMTTDGAGNSVLKHTGKERTLKACRAYFQFAESIVTTAREFVLDFGDDTQSIIDIQRSQESQNTWYTVNGMKVDKPTRKGLYIVNGRKVVIK